MAPMGTSFKILTFYIRLSAIDRGLESLKIILSLTYVNLTLLEVVVDNHYENMLNRSKYLPLHISEFEHAIRRSST
jgi:hypothetical protein